MNKTATKSIERGTPLTSRPSRTSSLGQAHPGMSAAPSLGAALGNQVLLQLLESGPLQAKLRVSQPGDPDEHEADNVADQVVAATHATKIQRKCACEGGGKPCAKCEEEEGGTIHRSVVSPSLRSSQLAVQRAPASDSSARTPDQTGNPPKPSPTPAHTHPLVVEDDAKSVGPHQMRKSAFIALLRTDACATADAVLESVGRTKSCPYIEKWLGFYEKQSADHIERALVKYAPETANARSAREAIRFTVIRVQRAAMTWAKTGKVTGLPEDLASQLPGQGFLGAVQSFAQSSVGGAILGFIGGRRPEKSAVETSADKSPGANISRKASDGHSGVTPAHDAGAVRSQLGSGHSLDSKTQSQMSSAFGHDFSGVRIHTDARASSLSTDLNARAFTIGTDVAFASGEYRPGSPIGDALIAHELAHVVQQSAAVRSPSPMQKAADGAASATDHAASQFESDADLSAVGAVASIWAGAKRGLADLSANAIARLRSGLRLQRCPKRAQAVHPAVPAAPEVNDTEPDMPKLSSPVPRKFADLPERQRVSDPTGRNHHIELERRGSDLFYHLANGAVRRVPRPIDKEKKPPGPRAIEKITWGGDAYLQLAFSVDYESADSSGLSLDARKYSVNVFGRAMAGEFFTGWILGTSAAEVSPEGLEYEVTAGTLSPRPKAKRFEDAKRYHLPDAPFSLYVFKNRTAEVANDVTGGAVGGPWANITDLKVSSSGDVSLIRHVKSGELTTRFSLRGPKFTQDPSIPSKDPKERSDLIAELGALHVPVIERGSRFSTAELQAALDVLRNWKGKKGVVESLKATRAQNLKLVKDILINAAKYDPESAEVRITGAVEIPEQEQRNMVTHEVTHALFYARGLAIVKGAKVPEHVKKEATLLHDLSKKGEISEDVITGPGAPGSTKDKKVRSQQDWEQALSNDAELNFIWHQLHTRFRIGDPEGTGDIRGMDAADESRYSGSSRGDVVGHGYGSVTEFLSSFVASSRAYQEQVSATILRAKSPRLAAIYKHLWYWVNTNLVALGKENPYDDVLAQLQKPPVSSGSKIQRKSSDSSKGDSFTKFAREETTSTYRSVPSPSLRSSQLAVQRAPAGEPAGTGSSSAAGSAAPVTPSGQQGSAPACATRSTNCTSADDPSKIVCDHKASPDTIEKPGDTVNITAKFACNVRSWVSVLETSAGKALNLREPKDQNTNQFVRSWDGKKQFGTGKGTLGTYLADDGDYRHRFENLLFAYKPAGKKTANLYAKGSSLISNTIKIKLRSFSGSKPEHFHYTPDNIAMLGDVIYSEVGIADSAEKKAVAWAVRNQMIRIGTAKVADAVNHFHDSVKQHTKVDSTDTPKDVKNKNESAKIADEILKKPMSDDPTGGAMRWFSPDSMPKEGKSRTGFDTAGGLIEVKDLDGKKRKVYSPSWSRTQTKVKVPGVRDWRLMLYKL